MKTYKLINGDCIEEMKKMDANSIDSIVTDPPYEIGFMGKKWDNTGIAYNKEVWKQALRVLKPGGHMLAFSSTRTYHRMVCSIEDSGFEIRDQLAWIYGSGFPKSKNMGVMVDKKNGVKARGKAIPVASTHFPTGKYADGKEKLTGNDLAGVEYKPETDEGKKWNGWGTALKPAQEPIVLARKPISESTIAKNVIKYGTGAIDIDNSRVATETDDKGRWPANIIHDGSAEVMELFPDAKGAVSNSRKSKTGNGPAGIYCGTSEVKAGYNDNGSAARFFYCAKANKQDRNNGDAKNIHSTVKPTMLMQYLVRMITPKGGTILDPFNGSGSTGKAAMILGEYNYIGIDLSADYITISKARIEQAIKNAGKIEEDTAEDTAEEETNFFIE
jgi:site-specific DNA-methyltransferase (adenine-specific)